MKRVRTPEQKEQGRLYRLGRVEKKREYDRAYRAARADEMRARSKQWREDNKELKSQRDREYRLNNPEKIKENKAKYYQKVKDQYRAIDLKRNYGMTVAEYDAMLLAQGGVCAICRGVNKNGKRLSVDHNHDTGAVRDLLCASCNLVIGHCREQALILREAIRYLEKHSNDLTTDT